MGQRPKSGSTRETAAAQQMRDEEVLRANRELAAYFKGQRTEREARAALRIIKAFVRDRERRDASSRAPLPGAPAAARGAGGPRRPGGNVAKKPKAISRRKTVDEGGERHRQKVRRSAQRRLSESVTASVDVPVDPEPSQLSESAERAPE
jgi:hypothetical protein